MKNYTIRYTPEFGGFSFEIRDRHRAIVGQGWVHGSRKNAEDDARNVIAGLMRKAAA